MKTIKYIFAVVLLGVVMGLNAQSVKGVVMLADEPVKGATISATNEILTKTNAQGEFELNQTITDALVSYKKLTQPVSFEALGYAKIVLVPEEKQLLKMMDKKPSLEKCEIFLANYPQSTRLLDVKNQQEELTFIGAYDKAVTTYDVDGLANYIANYPNGAYAAKATQTMEVISWQYARLQDTPQSYNEFLAKYPESKAAEEAAQRLANVKDSE